MTGPAMPSAWREPPPAPALTRAGVDVWRIFTPAHQRMLERYGELLSPVERQRCAGYRFGHLRERYSVRHAVLRLVLSHYLVRPPGRIEFTVGVAGKPYLQGTATSLQFNLSDSGDWAVVALTTGRAVGVDIERRDDSRPPLEICPQLAPVEAHAIDAASPSERSSPLYRIWVRKEAYLKALGSGLALPLDAFAVPTDPQPHWVLRASDHGAESLWEGRDFHVAEGYAGSVVTPSLFGDLRLFDGSAHWAETSLALWEVWANSLESDSASVL